MVTINSKPNPTIMDLSRIDTVADSSMFLEIRTENDLAGNPIYIGYNKTPNAGTAVDLWFIVKCTYDGSDFLLRKQLPDQGVGFKYAWDDRASLFS